MKLFELFETPIASYDTLSDKPRSAVGDPNEISKDREDFKKRSSSYTDKRDRTLLTNPASVKRMHDLFANNEYDFHFYMVNTKEARDFTEVGVVDRSWLEKNMPAIAPHIKEHPDGITVIFTNNKGAQKVPMTPWIVAHRIGHAFNRPQGGGWGSKPFRTIDQYTEAESQIDQVTNDILEQDYTGNTYGVKPDFIRKKFFQAIGTFRSARKGILRQDFEFLNELYAQYLTTGDIKFNPAPKKIVLTKAWGKDGKALYLKKDNEADILLDQLRDTLTYVFDWMTSQAVGKIFVM